MDSTWHIQPIEQRKIEVSYGYAGEDEVAKKKTKAYFYMSKVF